MRFFHKTKKPGSTSSGQKYRKLLPEFMITVIGTIIGVVLTVGVTYCSEKSDKESMARKIVMLTMHNLDVSIRSTERLVAVMEQQDSIFQYVKGKYDASEPVSADTLQMFISAFYSHKIHPIDTSTEAVFSSNFDIWRNIDDPKVISRIANCYSILRKCSEEYDRFEHDKYEAFTGLYDGLSPEVAASDAEVVQQMIRQNRINRIMELAPQEAALMKQMLENVKALHYRNKSQLGVSQEELDEIGRLI